MKFIPQRPPMVMLSGLLESSDVHAISTLTIEPSNIFTDKGVLGEPGLVENIAQTAAAQVGYQCQLKNASVPIGFIAAIRKLKVFSRPSVGTTITTTIRVTNQIMDITVVEGQVVQEGKVLCACEMRIFVKPSGDTESIGHTNPSEQ